MGRSSQGTTPKLDHTPFRDWEHVPYIRSYRRPKESGLTPAQSLAKHKRLRTNTERKTDSAIDIRRKRNVQENPSRRPPAAGTVVQYRNAGRLTRGTVLRIRARYKSKLRPLGGFWVIITARHGLERAIALEDIIE